MAEDRLARLKVLIIEIGLFVVFVVTFGEYVWGKVRHVIEPMFK